MLGFYITHVGGELIFELVVLSQAANKFFHSTPQAGQMCFGLRRTVVTQKQRLPGLIVLRGHVLQIFSVTQLHRHKGKGGVQGRFFHSDKLPKFYINRCQLCVINTVVKVPLYTILRLIKVVNKELPKLFVFSEQALNRLCRSFGLDFNVVDAGISYVSLVCDGRHVLALFMSIAVYG